MLSTIRTTIRGGRPNTANRSFEKIFQSWSQQKFETVAEVNDFELEAIEIAKG